MWLVEHGHSVEVFTIGSLDQPTPTITTVEQGGMLVHRLSFDIRAGDAFTNLYDNPLVGQYLAPILERGHFDLLHLVSGYLLGGQVIHTAHQAGIPVVLTLTEYFFMCPRLNLMHADSSLCVGPESDAKCSRCLLEDKRRFSYLQEAAPKMADAFWSLTQNAAFLRRKNEEVAARRQFMRDAFHQADLVIAPSHFILEKYAEFGYIPKHSVFIQHGVAQPDGFQKEEADPQPGSIRFGYIGQIKPHKGVDLITTAVVQLVDAGLPCSLQIWGRSQDNPDYYQRMQKSTTGYPAVRYCGPFEGTRVWNVLDGIDVLVVPSRWYENCPTVILEAFKMQIPVIATHIGGMAELVQPDKNGLTFALNDANDLSQQMRRLITEPGLLQKLKNGVPYIKSASEEVGEIFTQYEQLLAGRRPQSPDL